MDFLYSATFKESSCGKSAFNEVNDLALKNDDLLVKKEYMYE